VDKNHANSRQRARTWQYPRHKHFEEQLRQAAKEWFAARQYAVHPRYAFCLAEWADWHKNIIVPEVAAYIENIRDERANAGQGFPLHDYIHHGLSSQSLLFNLVGPLITSNDLDPLRQAVRSSGLTWPGLSRQCTFEYEDRAVFNEDSGQPTSVDLVIGEPETAGSLFVECKLKETGFGGCSVFGGGDCDGDNPVGDFSRCYLHHIGRSYWTLLQKHGFLKGLVTTDSTCIMANHYQFFRVALLALEKGGTFVLLSDERSPTFSCQGPAGERGLMPLLIRYVPERLRARVGRMSIQGVVRAIEASGRHQWIGEFKAKYGIV